MARTRSEVIPRTMRAAVQAQYGAPEEVVAVRSVPVPAPDNRQVLVAVRAAGANWADKSMTVGEPYVMRLGYGLRAPRRGARGIEMAGKVIALGPGVHDLEVGQDVFGGCVGGFAEYALAKADQLATAPAGVAATELAVVATAGCVALQAIRDVGTIETGRRVLVVGASGGIGSFAVQIAKAFGAHVTGVCSTRNLDFVRSLGADDVIDYTVENFTNRPGGYDLILDMADRESLAARRRMLAPGGTLIPNSGEGGRWFGSIGRIVGARLSSPFVNGRQRPFFSMTKREDLESLAELIMEGSVVPQVGATFTLEEAGAAIAVAGSGHARGKAVVIVSDGKG